METAATPTPYAVPPRHVVCATDMSAGARGAERAALFLARTFAARLTFVWIDPTFVYHAELLASSGGLTAPTFDPEKRSVDLARCADVLRSHVATVAAAVSGGASFDVVVDSGDPSLTLLSWMHSKGTSAVDLLVVGHKHRGALASFFLGSTATSLLEGARCPVMVVPERTPEASFAFQDVVLATDLTHTHEAPARAAWCLASAHRGRVTLVHAFDAQDYRPLSPDSFSSEGAYHDLADLFARASEIKAAHLAKEAEKIARWGDPSTRVACEPRLLEGSPKEAVLHYTRTEKPHVLVAGRWSQAGGIASFLLGSTARALAMHAETPVLVVPHET